MTSAWTLLFILVSTLHIHQAIAAKILFIGDSWAAYARQATSLEAKCTASWVINKGFSGSTAVQWRDYNDGNYLKNILEANADAKAIWITLGGNDVLKSDCQEDPMTIANTVRSVVNTVTTAIPEATILLTSYGVFKCPFVCGTQSLVNLASALEPIGNEFASVTFVDTMFLFGGSLSEPSDEQYFVDCIHLNQAGYDKLWDEPAVFDAICPPDDGSVEPSKRDSRRRLLFSSPSASVWDAENGSHRTLLKACGTFQYDVSLYVDQTSSHLYAIGHPSDAARVADCPMGATHAITLDDGVGQEKEIIFWMDMDEGQSHFTKESTLSIGSFPLQDLHYAFQKVRADDLSTGDSRLFDLFTNNCGTYLLNLAAQLGIKIDSRITSFVVSRLAAGSAQQLADKIRSSLHSVSLFGGRAGDRNLRGGSSMSDDVSSASEEQLIQMLVETTTATITGARITIPS